MRNGEAATVAALEREYGRLLTPGEAAVIAGIGTKALAGRADRGGLPCVRMGAFCHRRYPESAVRAIAAEMDMMSPGAVGAVLRVEPKTVSRWEREGRIEAARTGGGRRLFRREDIAAIANGARQ